jgi:Phosphotransferase enzyme family
MTEEVHLVHGLGREPAEPDWPALTDEEVAAVLGADHAAVTWRSPRPMSAAALVRNGSATVFVKRHHLSVRTPAQLAGEHAFAAHLRAAGQPVPAVLPLANGRSVMRRGGFCYEAHQATEGTDAYRDAVSWSPYASLPHAHAAGAALARLHLAAADFPRPARPPAVLSGAEAAALPRVLPVVHLEYALSEIDYFTSAVPSQAGADLAYDYLIGHARWFSEPQGRTLLGFLGSLGG